MDRRLESLRELWSKLAKGKAQPKIDYGKLLSSSKTERPVSVIQPNYEDLRIKDFSDLLSQLDQHQVNWAAWSNDELYDLFTELRSGRTLLTIFKGRKNEIYLKIIEHVCLVRITNNDGSVQQRPIFISNSYLDASSVVYEKIKQIVTVNMGLSFPPGFVWRDPLEICHMVTRGLDENKPPIYEGLPELIDRWEYRLDLGPFETEK